MKNNEEYSNFINGERIYLREVRISDVNENYYNWINNTLINQYLESRFYPSSIESIQKYVQKISNNSDFIFLAIINKKDNHHIGNIKLGPINWIHRLGEIGIIIGEKNYWGKGYATESIKTLSKHAFNVLNLHKLTAGCYETNQGSLKAFKKANFEIEGIRRHHNYFNGKYIDSVLLGLINPNQT